jgi:site-specific recombinase XerD
VHDAPEGKRRHTLYGAARGVARMVTAEAISRAGAEAALTATGLPPEEWAPREMRHSFVSLLPDAGMPLENIARLAGRVDTTTTGTVDRKQIRPVVLDGATAMDRIFPGDKNP